MSKIGYRIQQSLDELLEATGKKPKPSNLKVLLRTIRYFVTDLYYNYPHKVYCNIKNLYKNIVFFWPHILNYRDFDYHYSLDLFCDSLEHLAHGLKRWDNALHADRNYKRCLFAAKQLRAAYDFSDWRDKSYMALTKRNPIKWIPLNNGMTQMSHDYQLSEEYYSKMFKVINTRLRDSEERAKKDAWSYIHKHIQHFWD